MNEGQRDSEHELLEKFMAAVSGAELDDLRGLAGQLLTPSSARRPRREEPVTLRVRVDLDGARPPIWRRLDLRSDLTLAAVHEVLQGAFGWNDSHLHRFALGGGVFDPASEKFLCPWEVEEGDEVGVPTDEVRIDETLAEPGDRLRYCYDYGDHWELVIKLEEVRAADDGTPDALCVGGRRAAPPDDCGGLRTAAELAAVVPDPVHFDPTEVNAALSGPPEELAGAGLRPELLDLIERLRGTAVGQELAVRAWGLAIRHEVSTEQERATALQPHRWFLDRIGDLGLVLTAAGYLRPADVTAAAEVVPQGPQWIGAKNREADTFPVLAFREQLQGLGLVRKQKDRLLLTKAGRAARGDLGRLWTHLADRLPLGSDRDGTRPAGLVVLLLLASSPHPSPIDHRTVAEALTGLGWREAGGRRPISPETARRACDPTLRALRTLEGGMSARFDDAAPLPAVASDLAAHALRTAL